jgi:hypothetical protein
MGVIRKGARAQAKAAEAEAGLAEAEAKVAQEQAAAIARALHEDEVHRHADLEEVAGKEAEAVPWSRHAAADAGTQAVPDRQEHSRLCPLISVVGGARRARGPGPEPRGAGARGGGGAGRGPGPETGDRGPGAGSAGHEHAPLRGAANAVLPWML